MSLCLGPRQADQCQTLLVNVIEQKVETDVDCQVGGETVPNQPRNSHWWWNNTCTPALGSRCVGNDQRTSLHSASDTQQRIFVYALLPVAEAVALLLLEEVIVAQLLGTWPLIR